MCASTSAFILFTTLLTTLILIQNVHGSEVIQGKPGSIYRYKLNAVESIEISFPEIEMNTNAPYRVEVSSTNARRERPIFVVVRQEKSILSWQVPLLVEAANPTAKDHFVEYMTTGRTLCVPVDDYAASSRNHLLASSSRSDRFTSTTKVLDVHTNFTVTLSTFSNESVWVTFRALPVSHYFIKTDVPYDTSFSPSEPVYYAYQFPKNDEVKTVQLQVTSNDTVCFTVSVQPHICPIYDLQDQITYQGKYQTVSEKGGLVLYRKDFEQNGGAGFVVVFVAHADNYECDTDAAVPFMKQVRFKENRQISTVQFVVKEAKKSGEYGVAISALFAFNLLICLIIVLLTYLFYRFGLYYDIRNSPDTIRQSMADSPLTLEVIDSLQRNEEPKLSDFIHQHRRNRRVALNYFWHIANIAIFYGLPVIQLMVFYQRAVNYTGDLDLCYYNTQCAHPLYFNDFNHVYSNIGYIIFGVLFLGVTAFRNYYNQNPAGCGIPKLYGLYYAMGVALVFEGVLSACYHICPNQSNFQFDTSFMYVMAMLIMAKLYQNRHPDVQASAYSTFTVLGLSVTVAMFGIIYNSLPVLIVFFIMYVVFCVYMAFKMYFFANVVRGMTTFVKDTKSKGFKEGLKPRRIKLFVFVTMGLLINFTMAIGGFFLYPDHVDFGTYLLVILMGNAILYSIFYMTMKIVTKERITFETQLYGLIALVLWLGGGYFFFNAATVWSKTPAQSRLLNKDCMVMDFYDTHDIWHSLSAPALFFTFAFLITMDDDLVHTKHEEIKVF